MRAAGGCYFFTTNLSDRGSDLLVREVAVLRASIRATMAARPFRIEAMVVLPDHLHTVWTLPEGDADFSGRWRGIKAGFSRRLPEASGSARTRKGERGIWQRRFWEHLIRDQADFQAHLGYCWFNPVKHGLVARPEDWPWSSYRRDVERWGLGATP